MFQFYKFRERRGIDSEHLNLNITCQYNTNNGREKFTCGIHILNILEARWMQMFIGRFHLHSTEKIDLIFVIFNPRRESEQNENMNICSLHTCGIHRGRDIIQFNSKIGTHDIYCLH